MNLKRKNKSPQRDIYDIISATWILASNDENPIISYNGIIFRLGLPTNFDIKGLIKNRGELFRQGVPESRLLEWKRKMKTGHNQPSWIKDYDDLMEREKLIEQLTTEDVFRSQFRTEKDASQSPIEIISWGLDHIDRLRSANMSIKNQFIKRWEIWFVFAIGIINIIVNIISIYIKDK